LVGDVGEDGGAAGRNFAFGEEKKKAGEERKRDLGEQLQQVCV
jgi:hypothetical protein